MAERLAEFACAVGWRGHIFEVSSSELDEADRMPYDFAHYLAYDTTRIEWNWAIRKSFLPKSHWRALWNTKGLPKLEAEALVRDQVDE